MKFHYLDGHIPVRILVEENGEFIIEKTNKALEFVEHSRLFEEPKSFGNQLGLSNFQNLLSRNLVKITSEQVKILLKQSK